MVVSVEMMSYRHMVSHYSIVCNNGTTSGATAVKMFSSEDEEVKSKPAVQLPLQESTIDSKCSLV